MGKSGREDALGRAKVKYQSVFLYLYLLRVDCYALY